MAKSYQYCASSHYSYRTVKNLALSCMCVLYTSYIAISAGTCTAPAAAAGSRSRYFQINCNFSILLVFGAREEEEEENGTRKS